MLNESWGSYISSPAVFSTRKYVDSVTSALRLKCIFIIFFFCMQCVQMSIKINGNVVVYYLIFIFYFHCNEEIQYGGY